MVEVLYGTVVHEFVRCGCGCFMERLHDTNLPNGNEIKSGSPFYNGHPLFCIDGLFCTYSAGGTGAGDVASISFAFRAAICLSTTLIF